MEKDIGHETKTYTHSPNRYLNVKVKKKDHQ